VDDEALEQLRRHSGLSLDRDGTFFFQGERVPNKRVQDAFHRGLALRPDGDVTLHLGNVWAYVSCVGVARFVTRLRRDDETLVVTYRCGSRRRVKAPCVATGPGDRIYLWEAGTLGPAILQRVAHDAIAGWLEMSGDAFGFTLGRSWVDITRLPQAPGPAAEPPETP
jgi:hypothetical protein